MEIIKMSLPNCWEVSKCGEQNHCIAGTFKMVNGLGGGKNGGRICAYLPGTICGGQKQTTLAHKIQSCFGCSFYQEHIRDNFEIERDLRHRIYLSGS